MAAKISVIVPVYGTEKYLRTCLDSLRQQTLREAEFILVNDASPDGSACILADYARKDSRFRVVTHERNRGLYAARLTGLNEAAGDYVAFLDSDDFVSVDFYRAAVKKADEGGFDVVMGDTVFVTDEGERFCRPLHDECIPQEVLRGPEVRRAFYGQELQCYSWHTVWNKVYRRSLVARCLPDLEQLDDHVIMTEDVAFSCVLLYEARSLCRHRGDGVFYCMHGASATGAAFADQKRFFKNYGDIARVFVFVADFLRRRGDEENLTHLMNGARWYARMWREACQTCAPSGEARLRAEKLTRSLCPEGLPEGGAADGEIWWFDRPTVPWLDGLERIKRAIAGLDGVDTPIVSFDVFDTLIRRPFRQPSDVFLMLEDTWQKANRRSLLSFADARAEAEASCRAWLRDEKADVNLHDVYGAMRVTCGVTEDCADTMRMAEGDAEIAFCQPRRTGVQLFELARHMGKRVVLISDMFLPQTVVEAMLRKCGVDGWERFFLSNVENALKWNGAIYQKALDALGCAPGDILHIGDNWHNDCIRPRQMGLHTMHHPRAMDVMTDVNRTQLGQLGLRSVASFGGGKTLQAALSFRCVQALAANRFFDNGFAPTTRGSFFAMSPSLIGYYPVGAHVLAVAQWLIDRARRDGMKKLVFLARDGDLIRRAVDVLLGENSGIETCYHPASRRCLLPALTAHPTGFYALPINVPAYSVQKLLTLLSFCTVALSQDELRERCEQAGFAWEERFPGRYRFHEFITWYRDHLYDGCRHQQAYNLLRDYYEPVLTPDAACFDMGYSGRLQAALSQLAGRGVPVYFIHDDQKECPRLERAYEFEARCFYDMKPGMSGAFREFLLSSDEPPCTGFTRLEDGSVQPVYARSEYNAPARFFIRTVQRNALQMVKDYHATFAGTPAERVQGLVCSMPFESLLRYLTPEDLSLLEDIRFEDTVFAGRDDLDLATLVRDQSAAAAADAQDTRVGLVGFVPEHTPLVKRTIGFLLFDRALLREKAKKRLQKHPLLLKPARGCWRLMRKMRGALKRRGR